MAGAGAPHGGGMVSTYSQENEFSSFELRRFAAIVLFYNNPNYTLKWRFLPKRDIKFNPIRVVAIIITPLNMTICVLGINMNDKNDYKNFGYTLGV